MLIAVASLGCNALWPGERRVVGHIDFRLNDALPQVPETATVAVPQVIRLWTYGGGCHEGGDTAVEVEGQKAVLTPYDFLDIPLGGVCTMQRKAFEHVAVVVFRRPGTARIVLRYSSNSMSPSGDKRQEYTVEVAPAE